MFQITSRFNISNIISAKRKKPVVMVLGLQPLFLSFMDFGSYFIVLSLSLSFIYIVSCVLLMY